MSPDVRPGQIPLPGDAATPPARESNGMDTTSQQDSRIPFAWDVACLAEQLAEQSDRLRIRTYHSGERAEEIRQATQVAEAMSHASAALVRLLIVAAHDDDEPAKLALDAYPDARRIREQADHGA